MFLWRCAVLMLLPQAPPASAPSPRKRVVFVVGGPGSGKGTQVGLWLWRACAVGACILDHCLEQQPAALGDSFNFENCLAERDTAACLLYATGIHSGNVHGQSGRCSSTVWPCNSSIGCTYVLVAQADADVHVHMRMGLT